MGFTELYLYNFRNFNSLRINIDFPEVFFVGNNGQGKTNILEALYYLCYGTSFKTKNENIIIKNSKKQMAVAAKFEKNDGSKNKISIQIDNGLKKIILNEKNIIDRRDIIYNMPCIIFCHSDLDFVIGNPDKKRLFFDQTLSLLDSEYVTILRNYKKVLKNRNRLLKNSEDKNLIDIYTEKLIDYGLLIQEKREDIIVKFNNIIPNMFNKISDLKGIINIDYVKSWKKNNKSELLDYYKSKYDYEKKMKTSCYGPHRDSFNYRFDNIDFNNFASTGQLRLLSLILRSIQGIFYRRIIGKKPILLLDDVLLELDNEKRSVFMNNLPEYSQAFYTFLPDSSVLDNHKAKIFNIERGMILE